MANQFTNIDNLSVSLAVWLATDEYQGYSDDPNYISATTLIKPLREVVLSRQNKHLDVVADVTAMIASKVGNSYHDGIERAWIDPELRRKAMLALGYPAAIADRLVLNPTNLKVLSDEAIPVYLEVRSTKEIEGFTVSGQIDFSIEGRLEDFKSTSVWAYIFGSSIKKFVQQASIYRWLRPDIITEDYVTIQYIFTDWSASKAKQDPKVYPQKRILSQKYDMMSLAETEKMIRGTIKNIKRLGAATQDQLPLCTPEELWQKETIWKYYKNPANKVRSTKNFDNQGDAITRKAKDGNIGEVVEVPGEVVKCRYCKVAGICDQAQDLIKQKLLKL